MRKRASLVGKRFEKAMESSSHKMSRQTIATFLSYEKKNGANDNMMRRYKRSVEAIYEFLPDDKILTTEQLLTWYERMKEHEYSCATIGNYVKYINRYLRHVGCLELQFRKNSSKNIKNMTFGYLTALHITGRDKRKNVVWLCQCKCGNTIEVPATQLLSGNTLSCGCLYREHLSRANKHIENTNLRQALKDEIINTNSKSGYVGVAPKRDKWQAYITYQGTRYNLGVYADMKDAIKARTRAKEIVMEDATRLLQYYEEIHRDDSALPSRDKEKVVAILTQKPRLNDTFEKVAVRSNNRSGYKGVSFIHQRWEARICYKGIRYILGSYEELEKAVDAHKMAEKMLKEDAEQFLEFYSKTCRHHKLR